MIPSFRGLLYKVIKTRQTYKTHTILDREHRQSAFPARRKKETSTFLQKTRAKKDTEAAVRAILSCFHKLKWGGKKERWRQVNWQATKCHGWSFHLFLLLRENQKFTTPWVGWQARDRGGSAHTLAQSCWTPFFSDSEVGGRNGRALKRKEKGAGIATSLGKISTDEHFCCVKWPALAA